jgi:hypothetical protein
MSRAVIAAQKHNQHSPVAELAQSLRPFPRLTRNLRKGGRTDRTSQPIPASVAVNGALDRDLLRALGSPPCTSCPEFSCL